MNLPVLIFVRHGQTDWNRDLRLQGHRDIPLNDLGRRQAARNGRALAPLLDAGAWDVRCSPLVRARQTAEILLASAQARSLPVMADDRLKEIGYGAWEGSTLAEIEAADAAAFQAREADKWGFVPPEGESYADLAERIRDWLPEVARPTLVVAHGGVLRVLLHILAGVPSHDVPWLFAPQDRAVLFARHAVVTI